MVVFSLQQKPLLYITVAPTTLDIYLTNCFIETAAGPNLVHDAYHRPYCRTTIRRINIPKLGAVALQAIYVIGGNLFSVLMGDLSVGTFLEVKQDVKLDLLLATISLDRSTSIICIMKKVLRPSLPGRQRICYQIIHYKQMLKHYLKHCWSKENKDELLFMFWKQYSTQSR